MNSLFKNDIIFFCFEFFLLFVIIFYLIFIAFLSNKKTRLGYPNFSGSLLKSIFFIIIISFIILNNGISEPYYLFYNFYYSDELAIFCKSFILIAFFIYLFILLDNLDNYDYEFIIIVLFSLFGILLLVNSNDFISLFFIIEFQSLAFYILVASKQNSSFSTEAALKYFIIGSFSSGLMLFGISWIYGFTGGLITYNDVSLFVSDWSLVCHKKLSLLMVGVNLGILFLTVGLLFKFGAAPFHMWMLDVFEGAPTSIVAYLSTVSKIPLIFIFIKLYFFIFRYIFSDYQVLFIIVSIISVLIGSFGAVYQIKIKRLLAYSMVTNSSFFFFALSLPYIFGIYSVFFYLISYTIIMLGLFMILLVLRDWSNGLLIKRINTLVNMFEINPYLAFCLMILLFSIAGIPPFLGFYSKFFVFLAGVKLKLFWFTVILIILSSVSVYYYIRLVKLIYFNRSNSWIFLKPISYVKALIISYIVLFNIIFFVCPNFLLNLIYNFSFYFYL